MEVTELRMVQKHWFHYLGLATGFIGGGGPFTGPVIRDRAIPLGTWS